MFYQAVVAAVLLYGSETWCLTDTARRPLDGFHVEAARRITGKMPRKVRRGGGRTVDGSMAADDVQSRDDGPGPRLRLTSATV